MLMLVSIGMGLAASSPAAAQDASERESQLHALCGTWALQQVTSLEQFEQLKPRVLEPAVSTPNIRGFCLRVPWNAIDENFDLLDAGRKLAEQHGIDYSIRFMAGRHTPQRVFADGSPFYRHPGSGEKVPSPFNADGSPNEVFEKHYQQIVMRLADWCREHGVRLLHLAWYGQDWAELNHGKEVRAVEGYSYENWLRAHKRLLDIGLRYAGDDLSVEAPFSGYGPLTDAAVQLAQHVIDRIGPWNPRFVCQANGWGNGDWGAPSDQTEARFDRVWEMPIFRAQQAIQPENLPWPDLYRLLYKNNALYCEIYATSFRLSRRDQIIEQAGQFARHCRERSWPGDGG